MVGNGEGAGDGGLVGLAVGVGATGAGVETAHVAWHDSDTPAKAQRDSGLVET